MAGRRVPAATESKILALRAQGMGMIRIAKLVGVGVALCSEWF